ncbi:MAG: SUF system Fe-S cluster assembly regulator [Gammaproteobacteria bacterium]|nr:SUF system Fe-S cluster assembly regulator [Gammaproteobacteria bacterium]
MIRISKLADYACVLMVSLMHSIDPLSAMELSDKTAIHLPTVKKLLKLLSKNQMVSASRGALGGYQILGDVLKITVLDLVEAVDGPIAMTDCSHPLKQCGMTQHCGNRQHWRLINKTVRESLKGLSLQDLSGEVV